MYLVLVRHADTLPAVAGCPDRERTLSERGQAQLSALRKWLSRRMERLPRPWRLLVSPARRAQQTAAPLAEQMDLEPLCEEMLYEAEPDDFQALMAVHAEVGTLLMVAHNPGLGDLASQLLDKPFGFAPGDAVCLDLDTEPARIC